MFLTLGRTSKESLINFWRNGWLSIAAVSILTLSLYIIGFVLTVIVVAGGILHSFENRMNVSAYFNSDVGEEQILKAKEEISSLGEVASVKYVSKDKALDDFKKDNANEPAIMNSLTIIGDNPLLASLVIKTKSPDQYEEISNYLTNDASFKDKISRTNYSKNKDIISKLNNIIYKVKKSGLALAAIFAFISIINIFNTIRITIYTHRYEVRVMRLVGASNMFIRLPFVFEGIIYGLVATFLAAALLLATVRFGNPFVSPILPDKELLEIFKDNFWMILGVQAGIGVLLGVISSWIAIRKYLKI